MTTVHAALPPVDRLRIALVGYGEVGGIFGHALREKGVASLDAFDKAQAEAGSAPMRTRAARDRIALRGSAAEAVGEADLIVCAVTASNALAAAETAAAGLRTGAYFLDVNSASPAAKKRCAEAIGAVGGRYVESAVMTSVPPYGIAVPMLLGGEHAAALLPTLGALGFAAKVASAELGVASAIKMCRSVIVKGMEAIVIESFVAARRYGVEAEVLASLAETFPGLDWERQGNYFFSRVIQHGKRRAEEMRESAATMRDVGLVPFMASAIAERQQWVADLAREGTFGEATKDTSWRAHADAIERRASRAKTG